MIGDARLVQATPGPVVGYRERQVGIRPCARGDRDALLLDPQREPLPRAEGVNRILQLSCTLLGH